MARHPGQLSHKGSGDFWLLPNLCHDCVAAMADFFPKVSDPVASPKLHDCSDYP